MLPGQTHNHGAVVTVSSGDNGNDANTELLIVPTGADASTSFSDLSSNGHTVTANGSAQVDTGVQLLSAPTVLLDGTTDGLEVSDDATLRAGTGDFTVDCVIRTTSLGSYQTIATKGETGTDGWIFEITTGGELQARGGGASTIKSAASTIAINTEYHVALIRNGGTLKLYVDATEVASGSSSGNINNTDVFQWGQRPAGGGTLDFVGNMGNMRYSSVARDPADFPPSAVYG